MLLVSREHLSLGAKQEKLQIGYNDSIQEAVPQGFLLSQFLSLFMGEEKGSSTDRKVRIHTSSATVQK